MKIDYKKVGAVIFLICIFYIGFATFPLTVINLSKLFSNNWYYISTVHEKIDDSYRSMLGFESRNLQNKGFYINLHGLVARLMGQRYINERIKLDNGHLTEEVGKEDTAFAAMQLEKMRDMQKERGKGFLFVMAPNQLPKYEDIMPPGYTNYSNENADELLGFLEAANVPTLDLREEMFKEGMDHRDAFFVTDHHWTPETGLWAYTKIIEKLIQTGTIEPVDSPSLDTEEYNVEIFEDIFLGSFGKRTGRFFAGLDDFSVLTPKFETYYSVTTPYRGDIDKQGSFSEIIINKSEMEGNLFENNPYVTYGYAMNGIVRYKNEAAPVDLKVMAIGDSFSHVTYIYLPFIFSECDQVDMRYIKVDFNEYYTEYDPDIVIMLVNPTQAIMENTTYDFFNDFG